MNFRSLFVLIATTFLASACENLDNPFDNEREFRVGMVSAILDRAEVKVDESRTFVLTIGDDIAWGDYDCIQDEHDPDEGECPIFARNLTTGATAVCRCEVDIWEANVFVITESSTGRISIREQLRTSSGVVLSESLELTGEAARAMLSRYID